VWETSVFLEHFLFFSSASPSEHAASALPSPMTGCPDVENALGVLLVSPPLVFLSFHA